MTHRNRQTVIYTHTHTAVFRLAPPHTHKHTQSDSKITHTHTHMLIIKHKTSHTNTDTDIHPHTIIHKHTHTHEHKHRHTDMINGVLQGSSQYLDPQTQPFAEPAVHPETETSLWGRALKRWGHSGWDCWFSWCPASSTAFPC